MVNPIPIGVRTAWQECGVRAHWTVKPQKETRESNDLQIEAWTAVGPGAVLGPAERYADGADKADKKDIVDTAVAAGSFKTLSTALTKAGLVDALKGDSPFTVFAPTDDAFAKIPEGTVDSLLKTENREKLVSILKLHVASGRAYAADALAADKITTLQKEIVRVRMVDGKPRVNYANIFKTEIDASNGLIHVIDAVLMPHE